MIRRLSPGSVQAFVFAIACFVLATAAPAWAEAWKFGIMADTQWQTSPDNKNPNTVAVNVINHLNKEFIAHGVKLVVALGDTTDDGSSLALDTRATFAQALYNAGIGFYPLRGNHEPSQAAAAEFQLVFPQTQNGINNNTPDAKRVTTTYYGPPPVNTGTPFTIGTNFVSKPGFEGLTYSFDYGNTRFVLLDQFTPPSGSSHSTLDATDVAWVNSRLSTLPANWHALVFAHEGIITEMHPDNLFGANPTVNTDLQNTFMGYLAAAGVRYLIGGHDHMHNRAIVTSPDGNSKVQEIISAAGSYKAEKPVLATQSWRSRETPIAQELFTIGYYIVTVDGARLNIDYYASPNGCNGYCTQTDDIMPYTFTRRETYGYSLNGTEAMVPQAASYVLSDNTSKAVARGESGYVGTTSQILDGTNSSTGKDWRSRALTKAVDTGWAPKTAGTVSDILTLWGMQDSLATSADPTQPSPGHGYTYVLTSDKTDRFVLSMSYDPNSVTPQQIQSGRFGLAVKNAEDNWINAAETNYEGTKYFVQGPYMTGDPLGYYGIDTATNTAWAVVDRQGDFAVANLVTGSPELYGIIKTKSGPDNARVWTLKLLDGPQTATDAHIDAFSLTQTAGAACTPVIFGNFPLSLGDIAPGGAAKSSVQIDFTNCAGNTRFNATIDYSAGSGALVGSKTLYNQSR